MVYTFVAGEVATKAKLDQNVGPTTQSGIAKVTPVANTPTSIVVKFPIPFNSAPRVFATPASVVSGTSLKGVSVLSITTTQFTLYVYRTNTTNTYVHWQAWDAPTLFTTGAALTAQLLNQGADGMVHQNGTVSITPTTADVPKSANITFPTAFAATPTVVTTALTTVPGSFVKGTAVTEVEPDGCKVWLTRGSTAATTVNWIALGRM